MIIPTNLGSLYFPEFFESVEAIPNLNGLMLCPPCFKQFQGLFSSRQCASPLRSMPTSGPGHRTTQHDTTQPSRCLASSGGKGLLPKELQDLVGMSWQGLGKHSWDWIMGVLDQGGRTEIWIQEESFIEMDAVSQKIGFNHPGKDDGRWHECTVRMAPTKLGRRARSPKADTEEEINGQRRGQLRVTEKSHLGRTLMGQLRRTTTFQTIRNTLLKGTPASLSSLVVALLHRTGSTGKDATSKLSSIRAVKW